MATMQRAATPGRWRAAIERAITEGIEVRQLAGSGAWVATSGSDPLSAYEVAVSGGVAHGCTCPAGEYGDPVCKHRGAYYLCLALIDPAPEPPAPAVIVRRRACPECAGDGWRRKASAIFAGVTFRVTCRACRGSGVAGEEAAAYAA